MPKCPECGHENRELNKFCVNCGFSLKKDEPKPKLEPGATDQTKIAVGIIAAVIVFSMIAGAFWWSTTISYPGMSTATFTIKIDCNTEWQGAIGGLSGSTTKAGYGGASFTITSSIVSAVIQKQTEWGSLTVSIYKSGKLVATQSTSAPYGVVSVTASS